VTMNKEQLAKDMQYLRKHYGWNDAEVAEIRKAAKENPAWWAYWTRLAANMRDVDAGIFRPLFGEAA
jgi:hypothetical protein